MTTHPPSPSSKGEPFPLVQARGRRTVGREEALTLELGGMRTGVHLHLLIT